MDDDWVVDEICLYLPKHYVIVKQCQLTFSGVSNNSNIIVTNVSTGIPLPPYSEILWIKFKKWLRDKSNLAFSSIDDMLQFFLTALIEVPWWVVEEESPACQEDEDCG
jgi:hypothetical protein